VLEKGVGVVAKRDITTAVGAIGFDVSDDDAAIIIPAGTAGEVVDHTEEGVVTVLFENQVVHHFLNLNYWLELRPLPAARTAPDLQPLALKVEAIEPWLKKTRWYPMTYLLIPSVLQSADQLLAELAAYQGEQAEQATLLFNRLKQLRANFKRVK